MVSGKRVATPWSSFENRGAGTNKPTRQEVNVYHFQPFALDSHAHNVLETANLEIQCTRQLQDE